MRLLFRVAISDNYLFSQACACRQCNWIISQILDKDFAIMVHILIGTPCYAGLVHEEYLKSMLQLTSLLLREQIQYTLFTSAKESLITRARNTVVAHFLADSSFTHLLFIDSDIGFPADCVLRLLKAAYPVVGCVYPQKALNVGRL